MDHLPEKLDFEGAHNFRDMGGYPLVDGRTVRRGMLYRSDHLAHLTDADQALLGEIGIRTVIDLRREEERAESADRIDNPEVERIWLPVNAEGANVVGIRRSMERGEVGVAEACEFLRQANRHFTGVFAPVFGRFLHLLLDERRYPVVFHCSAGKDRAGFAAAMTLYALGASDETVMHDYLATNHCTANYLEGMIDGLKDTWSIKVEPEAVRTLMQAMPEYLAEAIDIIEKERGGVHAFLESDLGFDRHKRAQLVRLLAE